MSVELAALLHEYTHTHRPKEAPDDHTARKRIGLLSDLLLELLKLERTDIALEAVCATVGKVAKFERTRIGDRFDVRTVFRAIHFHFVNQDAPIPDIIAKPERRS